MFEVVYVVEGEIAPSRSHLELSGMATIREVKVKLNELLAPTNKKVARVTSMVELPHTEGQQK